MNNNSLCVRIYITVNSKCNKETKHQLIVYVHNDIVKNKKRFQSHCTSVAKKSYGNKAIVDKIVNVVTEKVLYEKF